MRVFYWASLALAASGAAPDAGPLGPNNASTVVPQSPERNVTWLLKNVWLQSPQSVIHVAKQLFATGAEAVPPLTRTQSFQRRLEWLDAIAQLSERGYEFRMDFLRDQAVFGMLQQDGGMRQPRIPFVIHQTWKTTDIKTHSLDAVACTMLLKKHAPDFYLVLWTDSEIIELIKIFYPSYLQFYLKLNMNIKRADIARYLILQKFGGVYVDLDIEFRGHVGDLIMPSSPNAVLRFVSYRSREFESKQQPFAGNAFFACTPKSPIVRDVIKHALTFRDQKVRDVEGVLKHTGPMGLGEVVAKYVHAGGGWAEAIRMYNSTVVGNVEDGGKGGPSAAVHRRKHKWGPASPL